MTEATSTPPRPTHRVRTWLKRGGIALLCTLGLAGAGVAGGLLYFSTDAGGERLRLLVVGKANEAITGTLAVGKVHFGLSHLVLDDVELRDPDGDLVAAISTVELRLKLSSLVRKTLQVSELSLLKPKLFITMDAEGSNLSRAIALRNPKATQSPPQEQPSQLTFLLDQLKLSQGAVDFEQVTPGSERRVSLDELMLEGTVAARQGGELLDATLQGHATFDQPFEGPLTLALKLQGQGEHRTVDVDLSAGGAQLRAEAVLEGSEKIHLRLDTLDIPPSVARAFVPSYPLIARASVEGEADKNGDQVSARLKATVGKATAALNGSFNLGSSESGPSTLTVKDLDLAQVVENGPRSDLEVSLRAQGGGKSLETAHGQLALEMPPASLDGAPFGPVSVKASAAHGHFALEQLLAMFPGLKLNAHGSGSMAQLALDSTVVATDLALFGRTVGKLASPKGLPISGKGTLQLHAEGPTRHPGVRVKGQFPQLTYQDTVLNTLTLEAEAADVTRPLEAQAKVGAISATVNKKLLMGPQLALTSQGRAITLRATSMGPNAVGFGLEGLLDKDREGLQLSALNVDYFGFEWALEAPAHLRFAAAEFSTQPITLVHGSQSVSVVGEKKGDRIDAGLKVLHLDLGQLPAKKLKEEYNLAGLLDLDLRARGKLSHPDVTAKLTLENGRFKKYSELSLALDATYLKDRAKGSLHAQGVGLKLDSQFDLPVISFRGPVPQPIHLDAEIAEFKLDDLLRVAGEAKGPLLSGWLSAHLNVDGMSNEPRVELVAQGRDVRYEQVPPTRFELTARSSPDHKLFARVDLTMLERKSFVEVRTPFTAGRLLRSPPTQEQVLRAPMELEVELDRTPLPLPYISTLNSPAVLGSLTAKLKLHGTPLAPIGEGTFLVKGLTTGKAIPFDLAMELQSTGEAFRVGLKGLQKDVEVLALKASVAASIGTLRNTRVLPTVPLKVEAHFGPLELAGLQQLAGTDHDEKGHTLPQLKGVLQGELTAQGTLSDPRFNLTTAIEGLGSAQSPATANGKVALQYQNARSAIHASMISSAGGNLQLAAQMPMDLSYHRGQATPSFSGVPIDVHFYATDFNLSFLSGLTPQLTLVGGTLVANAEATGTVGAPRVKGELEWKKGLLELAGSGEIKDIHLALSGSQERIDLKDLSANSGRGRAHVTGQAVREGERYVLHAEGDLDKFPILYENQLMATVSMKTRADGQASAKLIDIPQLQISEARVELPDVKRKDLQKLDEPEDVLFVRNGVPVKKAKKAAHGTAAPPAGVGGSGTGEVPAGPSDGYSRLIRVGIQAPRNLWVKGNDINAEVGLDDGFRVEVARDVLIFGGVKLIRGRLDVFGRRFDVQENSKVRFTGPMLKPLVDVSAKHVNKGEGVVVLLRVQGRGEQLTIEPTSEPPLSETEIFTLLATGRRSLKPGSGATSSGAAAASIVGSLATSALKEKLEVLPLDVLSIESGDEGISSTKLEAGTYLGDRLYIGFTGQLGVDPQQQRVNANAVRMEYQLSKRWSLQAEYGDAHIGGADLLWSREY